MSGTLPEKLKQFPYFNDLREYHIGNGWTDLFYDLCQGISQSNPPKDFSFTQIKEKFGGARFYCGISNYQIFTLINKAEKESYQICESCGTKNDVTTKGGWVKTLCGNCRSSKAV